MDSLILFFKQQKTRANGNSNIKCEFGDFKKNELSTCQLRES